MLFICIGLGEKLGEEAEFFPGNEGFGRWRSIVFTRPG
jgi:hypothetical protein